MGRFLLRRVLRAATTLVGTTLLLFLLVRVLPADPAVAIAGPKADAATRQAIRTDLGLDDPLPVQYGRWLGRLVRGDLGVSYVTGRHVADVVAERIPATALLALTSLALGLAGGVLLGCLAAARRGSWWDRAILVAAVIGLALPTFWLGNLLVWVFGYRLQWLPLGGYGSAAHLILPAATLAIVRGVFYARVVRGSVGEALDADWVRTARAKGLPASTVLRRHALPNGMLPVLTLVGLDLAELLSGVVLTETVFNWPGLGRLAVQAVFTLDVPVMAGTVLVAAVLVVGCNILVDLLYGVLDPRVQRA
jgi:peptide/nickel transport system permease protein